jgi:hypothetical protein
MDYIKLLFRVLHVASACFIIGNVAGDFWFTMRSDQGYVKLIIGLCVVIAISGTVNSILLRPSKLFREGDKSYWMGLIYLKSVLFLGLTPLPEKLAGLLKFDLIPYRLTLHFVLITAILLISSLAKQYRDSKTPAKES